VDGPENDRRSVIVNNYGGERAKDRVVGDSGVQRSLTTSEETGLPQSETVIRIAVDAMGGDFAPAEIVRGAVDYVNGSSEGEVILLLGDPEAIRAELAEIGVSENDRLIVVPTSQVVTFDDHPMEAFRGKPDSSLVRSVAMVKEGAAEAAFSAGNTGAFMIAATLTLEKMVQRPAIATLFPTETGRHAIVVDVGANVDCRPPHMAHFAVLGAIFAETALKISSPRVGLLSNGEEEGKGDELTRESYKLFHEMAQKHGLNFIGYVEGNHVFEGRADVVVCDGFVGNVLLKGAEGLGRLALRLLENQVDNAPNEVARETLQDSLASLRKSLDYAENGGAPLLGVNGVVMIAHGRSDRRAIRTGIRNAVQAARSGFIDAVRETLKAGKA
jgi:glycerol-3-phosphate acyltransferase PlsX